MFKSKYLLSLGLVLAIAAALYLILHSAPKPSQRPPSKAPQLSVKVQKVKTTDFQFQVSSFGLVQPRTRSVLQSQVAGEIIWLSPNFRDGSFFEKGELLLKLDARDHEAKLKTAQANLLGAQQALVEEQARAEQAQQDWIRLNPEGGQASPLVLRQPQLASVQAKVLSAQAEVQSASLNVSRSQIHAPFAGRVLSKKVDIGQLAANNSALADIYATDYVEIRLPLKQRDLPYVQLPESYRDQQQAAQGPEVTIHSDLFGQPQHWQGRIVRTESAIDSSAQQLYVVAQIDDPFSSANSQIAPLKIGQYVTATIKGKSKAAQIVIPNQALYQNAFVYIVENNRLQRRELQLEWQNDELSVVASGLQAGDLLVMSPLGQVNSGTLVSILNAQDQTGASGAGKPRRQQPKAKHEGEKP